MNVMFLTYLLQERFKRVSLSKILVLRNSIIAGGHCACNRNVKSSNKLVDAVLQCFKHLIAVFMLMDLKVSP